VAGEWTLINRAHSNRGKSYKLAPAVIEIFTPIFSSIRPNRFWKPVRSPATEGQLILKPVRAEI